MKIFQNSIFTFLAILAITSCKPNVANVPHPLANEFLTTTILNLKNLNNASDTTSIWYYLDPNNPTALPIIKPDSLRLKSNSTYSCTVLILDQTKTPADTVSDVIKQRENIHLFFYFPTPGLALTDSITDHDTNIPPLPFGLMSQVKTGTSSTGSLRVVLRHQPNVKNGTYTPGSTDLDVTYPVSIK